MSTWNVSVLTTTSSDTAPTLLVNFGAAKYIFNAGENVGRSWLQSHHSIRNTKGIFLTAAGTHTCGGVPGLLMICADASVPSMTIVGPRGLMHYLATMRGYTYRSNMSVDATEAPCTPIQARPSTAPPPVFTDEHLTVYSFPLYPSTDHTSTSDSDSPQLPMKRKRFPSPASSSKRPAHLTANDIVNSTPTVPATLSALLQATDFSPSTLTGDDAQAWRTLILGEMFPLKVSPEPHQFLSKKAKSRARQAVLNAVEPSASKSTIQASDKKYARLPRLTVGNESGSSSLPTLGYLLVGPIVRGKFDAQKAEALGVPRGPVRSRLTRGETITFDVDDGQGNTIQRTVKPEECVGPNEVAQAIVILDVPTPAHIPSLLASFTESSFLSQHRSKLAELQRDHPVHAVYHICGDGVLEDDRYKAFMGGFSDDTHHILFSREHTPDKISFTQSALLQAKLNQLDAEMFPVPKYSLSSTRELALVPGLPPRTILAEPHTQLHVRPARPPVRDELAKEDGFNSLAVSGSSPELSSINKAKFASVQAQVADRIGRDSSASEPGDDVVITPLGTGSAIPSRLRNVSGTLIQIPGHGNILLDCGEGTWGQLVRSFGDGPACTTGVWQVLRDLKCIFLSHMHGDHHMGLSKILMMRTRMNPPPTEPLYVVGLRQHIMYILERQELENHGLVDPNGVVMILSDALNWRFARPYGRNLDGEPFMDADRSRENAQTMCRALGLRSFTTVDVAHRIRCYGVVIRHQDRWGIVFSGDTMPTDNLVKVGHDVTLLIHESSMRPEEEDLAREKAHSTSEQAVDVGRRMRAQKVLLTHFSARYPGMPSRQGPGQKDPGGPLIGLAFDYARIRLGDMWKLNMYLPAIEKTLDEFGEEGPMEIDLTKIE